MRLSTSMMYSNGLKGILAQESDMNRLVEQVGSGRKFLSPADDPLAAARAIDVAQTQSMNNTYGMNRQTANTNLGQESNTLTAVTNALQEARTRIIQAGSTLSDSDRRTLSTALKSTRDALLGLANTTDGNGQYLFSGNNGSVMPYSKNAAGQITYSNSIGERTIQVDQSRQMSTSDLGKDIFGRANPGSQAYVASTPQTNTGSAQFGAVSVAPGTGGGGKTFEVTYEADAATGAMGYRITTTNPDGSSTVVPQPPQAATLYADGAAVDFGGVSVAINGTPKPGDSIKLQSVQSTDMDVFATLDNIIAALDAPNDGDPVAMARLNNALATGNKKLANNYDNVLTVQASVGARQNELDALNATGTQKGLSYSQSLSDLEELDYYQGASQLALRQVALQAASAAFMTIQGSSLFSRK
ncbi:flagellar hook-associated protein FlgL [Achromobacter aegrifaciens]|uniref:flagellar hook-associated protein FlgL n=1 Tax=Achromobacter aegrifaciens TaxID=1287736 RepID=UPI000F740D4E|nr:flagellar hook-associated protein FlgL [Achromobacter aegrifaciens]RSE92591.1 flagellar hook-associated protein 3 [Achromobacter aegrifaciens]